MKFNWFLAAAAFAAVCALSAFIGWCGGFNFDQRNMDVGVGVAMTLCMALGVAGAVGGGT